MLAIIAIFIVGVTGVTGVTDVAGNSNAHSNAHTTGKAHDATLTGSNGNDCVACTIVISLTEQYAQVHNASINADLFDQLCDLLPTGVLRNACVGFFGAFGADILELLANQFTPDVVCTAIKLCDGTCNLFPIPKGESLAAAVSRARAHVAAQGRLQDLPAICNLPGLKELCNLINNFANNHFPIDDVDKDGFSDLATLRGSDWRGKDCNDKNANVHAGALPINEDRDVDSNCNGIWGVNPATQVPYETELCADTGAQGIVALGDSASAHFHVPPAYFEVASWTNHTFKNILSILEDEFDWPELSATTAFFSNTSAYPDISGPVNSTYLIQRSRNLCNHRDYQNIAVNGARVGDMNTTIVRSMSRNQATDKPVLAIYALIGNDVCNGHVDTLSDMTTPADYQAAVLAGLEYLDTVLPAGSHIMTMGLADGSVLYEALAERIHPIGMLRNDVTYAMLYDYLNCLSISPCRGWMNSNATLRSLTTQHAELLTSVLKNISATANYKHFDVFFVENPVSAAIAKWNAAGGSTWQLIEPVDGFHPNQQAQVLIVDVIWAELIANFSHVVPPVNPNNALIAQLFGDQGGH